MHSQGLAKGLGCLSEQSPALFTTSLLALRTQRIPKIVLCRRPLLWELLARIHGHRLANSIDRLSEKSPASLAADTAALQRQRNPQVDLSTRPVLRGPLACIHSQC